MKKTGLLFVLAFSALGLAWNNEFGVIPKTFQVQLSGNTVLAICITTVIRPLWTKPISS